MKKYVLHTFLFTCLLFALQSCYKNSLGVSSELSVDAISSESDTYNEIVENPFVEVDETPISTFSIDADGGAYSNIRRYLEGGNLPPSNAIRTEEMLNYFEMDYPNPISNHPIALNGEVSSCPWTAGNKLIRIGIKGERLAQYPVSNLIFLVDVSGSMRGEMDLVKESLQLFVEESIGSNDKVGIVTYAGEDKILLDPTSDKGKILKKIKKLNSGGGTNGAQGIITAYELLEEHFVEGANNRVILASDGNFNIGITDQDELISLIEEKRESGIFLTTLGYGYGGFSDANMEQIANHGNGTYEFIDDIDQAEKVFVEEFGKFFTVAKDVKVQVEFNAELVHSYRLIGYENRLLETEDFEDDTKDAGEIGSGQTITALYEIVPQAISDFKDSPTFTIDFRYKYPDEDSSQEINLEITDEENSFDFASENMRFAASLTGFAMLMRDSPYKGTSTYDEIIDWATNARTFDPNNHRAACIDLMEAAKDLSE